MRYQIRDGKDDWAIGLPRLNRNTRLTRMTRLTWVASVTRVTILPTMTRLNRILILGRLTCLTLLDRMTILTSAISMARLNVDDRQEELYRLTVMAANTRLTRTVGPGSRQSASRG